jgi:hypothetical protein
MRALTQPVKRFCAEMGSLVYSAVTSLRDDALFLQLRDLLRRQTGGGQHGEGGRRKLRRIIRRRQIC